MDDSRKPPQITRTQTTSAVCHQCETQAAQRHSRYRRRLHALAAGGRPVLIVLEVSRFFCDNTACGRRTFAERVPVVTRRHGRRTALLHRVLVRLGLALAGRAGARLDRHPPRPARRTTAPPIQDAPGAVPGPGRARPPRPRLRRHPHPSAKARTFRTGSPPSEPTTCPASTASPPV
ncbi:transposase family protein [Actinomadura sp. 9N215]|uniref:transposase family protein n=1 Tax=Actinomadura sp. 9N215 TaxID=3375150 RepID=UPI0037B3A4AE